MCKIKQLNGDAPRMNNYCTAREYEVFVIIAKNDNYKVGDLIDGEQLTTNKTAGRIWEITECDRTDRKTRTIISPVTLWKKRRQSLPSYVWL